MTQNYVTLRSNANSADPDQISLQSAFLNRNFTIYIYDRPSFQHTNSVKRIYTPRSET